MPPCPICGKNIHFNEGRMLPDFGMPRRKEYCKALGVPPDTFNHIKTRRAMCFSHFDADQFHMGRHILKRSALPKRFTEKERFILLNSGFNKERFRQVACTPSTLNIRDETDFTSPPEDDDVPTSSSQTNDQTDEVLTLLQATIGADESNQKAATINNRLLPPKIKRIPVSNALRKMYKLPVNRVSLDSPAINCTPIYRPNEKVVVKVKEPKETVVSAGRRFKLIKLPSGSTPVTTNNQAILKGSNDMNNVQQTSSTTYAYDKLQTIKREPNESDVEVLPSTCQSINNDDAFNDVQEAANCSNTNLILSRCLQYSQSLPDDQSDSNDVKIKDKPLSNSIVKNGYQKSQKI
uniref:THAP-type domain-containing protein n=1 Tax=Panagrolaimus davidi TaxID=227884 RepID=A0A914PNQ5_9BILA